MVLVIDMQTRAVLYSSPKHKRRSVRKDPTSKPRPVADDLQLQVRVPGSGGATKTPVRGLLPVGGEQEPEDGE